MSEYLKVVCRFNPDKPEQVKLYKALERHVFRKKSKDRTISMSGVMKSCLYEKFITKGLIK